jgi:threonyl-tRNA synthetase
VMIHRTLLGSMERFVGGLVEHYAGAFPMWLAPTQAALIPITGDQIEYANEVARKMKDAGIRAEVDDGRDRMQAKIRNAQLRKIPFMLVIGKREAEAGAVAIRLRTGEDLGAVPVEDAIDMMRKLNDTRSLELSPAVEA